MAGEDVSERILRMTEVKKIIGLSRSSIYLMMKKGQFPAQVKIGKRAVGWFSSRVFSWVEMRDQTPPK
jgi:prophage regulatory protein